MNVINQQQSTNLLLRTFLLYVSDNQLWMHCASKELILNQVPNESSQTDNKLRSIHILLAAHTPSTIYYDRFETTVNFLRTDIVLRTITLQINLDLNTNVQRNRSRLRRNIKLTTKYHHINYVLMSSKFISVTNTPRFQKRTDRKRTTSQQWNKQSTKQLPITMIFDLISVPNGSNSETHIGLSRNVPNPVTSEVRINRARRTNISRTEYERIETLLQWILTQISALQWHMTNHYRKLTHNYPTKQ